MLLFRFPHLRTTEIHQNHQKSMISKMNQDTYGDVLGYHKSLGMTFETTRLHKTWCQEVIILQNYQDSNRNISWGQHLRSDSEHGVDTIWIYIKHHFNLNWICFIRIQFYFWNLETRTSTPCCWRTFWFSNLGHSSCGWEGVRACLPGDFTWEHQKSTRNHQNQLFWKWTRIRMETS